jgi:hypothetical protein
MKDLLQYNRPQSMYDSEVHNYISEALSSGENFGDDPDKLWEDFKNKFHHWIVSSKLNSAQGLDKFQDRDIITGVTQFIDDIYQTKSNVKVLPNEYKYHWRMYGDSNTVDNYFELKPGDNLIISVPFPAEGDIHTDMNSILEWCYERAVDVHVDACWWGCSRDLEFNFDHPAIKSIGFSLSKALGLGANRIGVRYCRQRWNGPVTLHNEFNMCNQALVWLGTKFIDRFGTDFWWNKYGDVYKQVCRDLDLTPTKAIHVAYNKDRICGVRPILRKVYNER